LARYKTFTADGVVTSGRIYAGDLNGIQDWVAQKSDFTQTVDVATLRIGDSSLQITKFGTNVLQVAGTLALAIPGGGGGGGGQLLSARGVGIGSLTQAAISALTTAERPTGLIVWDSTNSVFVINMGTGLSPNWQKLTSGFVSWP